MTATLIDLAVKPGLGLQPLTLDCHARDTEYFRGFFDTHSAKVPQLDKPAFPLIDSGEFFKRLVQGQYLGRLSLESARRLVKSDLEPVASALGIFAAACVVYQQPAHYLCSDRKKMRPALPFDIPLAGQT